MSGTPAGTDRPEPSAAGWLARLRAGDLSARELAQHYLDRLAVADRELNAVVALDPERVLAEADRADAARRAGQDLPLLGLPMTVKDCIDTEQYVTTAGSHAWADRRPARDATAVARLRAAGAIVLVKTNLPEVAASYETDNALFGRTNNPHDVTRTPGGSSGGEAALLGAGASPAGLGTDGGGSIRVPSHFCGIAGLRPTVGRVPETGLWPPSRASGYQDFVCIGPMARAVEDLALLLPIIAGPDGIDPYALPVPLDVHPPVVSRGRRRRAAVYEDDGTVAPTAGTRAALRRAAALLEADGYEIELVTPPPEFAEATELFFSVVGIDGGAELREQLAPAGGRHHPQFAELLASFPATPPSAADYFARLARVQALRARVRAWVAQWDVVLCPVVPGPAPPHGVAPAGVPQERYIAYEAFNYVHTYALAGVPAASVPAGGDGGLPIGVQVVGPAYREDLVLEAARVIERVGSPPVGETGSPSRADPLAAPAAAPRTGPAASPAHRSPAA